MRIEITSAAQFLVDLVRLNNTAESLSDDQLERFKSNVTDILQRHYTNHWFPDKPFKGSGYRCIRINGKMDPLIARAGFMMGLAVSFLRSLFPSELTMWVDPREVCYRIGENGSICILYEGVEKTIHPKKCEETSTANSSNSTTAAPTEGAKTPEKCAVNHQQQVPSAPSTPPSSSQQSPSPPPAALPHHHHQLSSPPPQQQVHHHQHHHHPHHHFHQHHFSPSKSAVVVSSPLQLSRPMSPAVVTSQHQQVAAAAAAAAAASVQPFSMLFMNKEAAGHNGLAASIKCKESLPRGLEVARPLQMDQRLFVSS